MFFSLCLPKGNTQDPLHQENQNLMGYSVCLMKIKGIMQLDHNMKMTRFLFCPLQLDLPLI